MPDESYGDRVNGIWKAVALTLAGALMSLCVAWITMTKDAIGRAEVESQNARLEERVRQLQIDVARISERMGIPAHPGDPQH